EAKLLRIIIMPPWYLRLWAYVLYLIIVFIALYFYITLRKKRLMLIYESKIAQLELEKEKEIRKKKMDSFAEIIHEIKIPLTMILNPLKALLRNDDKQDLQLYLAYQNANRLYALTEQFSIADLEQNNLGDIELAEFEFHQFLQEE